MSIIAPAEHGTAQQTAYLAEAIADEQTLAALLGFSDIDKPTTIGPNTTIWASRGKVFAGYLGSGTASTGKIPLLRWRREWSGAGELIARCKLDVRQDTKGAGSIWSSGEVWADWTAHPDRDSALRFVVCKAAIAHLSAERAA